MLYQLSPHHIDFPPLSCALTEPNGLLAIGGDLQPQRILNAYQQGIFPWYSDADPLMWWSPDPRAIIFLDDLRVNRTLRKALKKSPYKMSVNLAFEQVTALCADAPFRTEDTWILPEMEAAYLALHKLGKAHSIEVWQNVEPCENSNILANNGIDGMQLVGGLYGVAINGFFSGESMFYSQPNASKFALVALKELLQSIHVKFIDCQLLNPFLADMGAIEISRADFIKQQQTAINTTIPNDFWQPRVLNNN